MHFAKHNNTIERQRLNDEICANYTLTTTLFIVILKKMREDTKKSSIQHNKSKKNKRYSCNNYVYLNKTDRHIVRCAWIGTRLNAGS